MPKNISPALDYIRKTYAVQDALLLRIDAALHALGTPIHIGAEEGRLLQMLMRLHGVKTVVEVGTLAGYSTLWMARALPRGGHIHSIEKDPKHAAMARGFFAQSEVKDRISLREGDAQTMLENLAAPSPDGEGIQYDMLFIDADKPGYNAYLDWAERHIRKGGLIVADNTLLFGSVYLNAPPEGIAPSTWSAMRRFNSRLSDPEKYFAAMIPTEEGLSVAIKLF